MLLREDAFDRDKANILSGSGPPSGIPHGAPSAPRNRGRRDEAKERHVWSTPRYHERANNPVELKRTSCESSYRRETAAAVHLCSVTRDAFALRNCLRRFAACSSHVTGLSFTTCGAALFYDSPMCLSHTR